MKVVSSCSARYGEAACKDLAQLRQKLDEITLKTLVVAERAIIDAQIKLEVAYIAHLSQLTDGHGQRQKSRLAQTSADYRSPAVRYTGIHLTKVSNHLTQMGGQLTMVN